MHSQHTMKSSCPIISTLLHLLILAVAPTPSCCSRTNPTTSYLISPPTKHQDSIAAPLSSNKIFTRRQTTAFNAHKWIDRNSEGNQEVARESSFVLKPTAPLWKRLTKKRVSAIVSSFLVILFLCGTPPAKAVTEVLEGATRQLSGNLASLMDNFFISMPYTSAFVTCGIKSSFADFVAQFKMKDDEKKSFNFQRNAAYILYGGIYLGCGLKFIYASVFPILFGTGLELSVVASKVLFDNFVLSPFLTFPLAYVAKSIVNRKTVLSGIQRYVHDVKERGLLFRAWALWIPVQSLTFSVVPDHLQIPFIAYVSFFWLILLSSIESASDNKNEE
jgi:hypothetical protein